MSLLPFIFDNTWYDPRPSRILDQHFGMGLDLDDLVAPFNAHLARLPTGYIRPWRRSALSSVDSSSTIVSDKDKFQVNLDVQQFKPEEITVKVTDNNTIMVEAKHEEKQDEHGMIYRHFVRKYCLPEGHDINGLVSKLSSDGVLSITAPRVEAIESEHRTIPIQQTGAPLKQVQSKKATEAESMKTD